MILRSLVDYYDRRANDPDPGRRLPAFGLEDKEIKFVVELAADGRVLQLVDTRQPDGRQLRGQRFLVPQGVKKTSGISANLLWDSAEYTLGLDRGRNALPEASPAAHFRRRIEALPKDALALPGVQAVIAALGQADWAALHTSAAWSSVLEENPVVSFRLAGQTDLVCQHPLISAAVNTDEESPSATATCLIDGTLQPVARLHPAIKNVWGAQTSGANIVSFNARAFESYGKTERQGENAPIGVRSVFAYTTALNHLLARGSRNRVQVGDSSTVFWADRENTFDGQFTLADFFGESDDPDRSVAAVQALLQAIQTGRLNQADGAARFHVLGLAPNASRIAIRFWLHATLAELAPRIAQHFADLAVVRRYDSDPVTPSLFRLLCSLAVQGKSDNVPPRLAGEWMRAILEGAPYPAALLNTAVMRCRAEREVSYLRAAILKAGLNRELRMRHPGGAAFKEELDVNQDDGPYRVGRLFAVLEQIQQRAQPGINATIRDRYFGAASTTPAAVFTTLLRLKNAHLRKLPTGQVVNFERLVGEIMGTLEDPKLQAIPDRLTLREQARFALGYYHQRQSFYTRKQAGDEAEQEE